MMDPNLKDRLMTALHDAVTYYNHGDNPTDAVIKSAKLHDFNIDQAQRLVETFNTAKSIHHFHKNAKSGDKSGSFDLANSDAVIVGIFNRPSVAKSATDINYTMPTDNFASADFDLPPVKAASVHNDTNIDTQFMRANKQYRIYAATVKDAQDNAEACNVQAGILLNELLSLTKRGSVEECKDKFARLSICFATPEYKETWDKFSELIPAYAKIDETEARKYGEVISTKDLIEHKDMFKKAVLLYEQAKSIHKEAAEIQEIANSFKAEFDGLVGEYIGSTEKQGQDISDFFVKGAAEIKSLGPKEQKNDDSESSNALISALNTNWKATANEGISGLLTQGIPEENKQISNRMRNLHRTAILQDLIINDPVISDVDPKITAQAYNTIMQTAPETSINKEVVRSILRQSVHSLAVSPFDAATWADFEKKLKELQGTMPPAKSIRFDTSKYK